MNKKQKNWVELVNKNAYKWEHVILKITGEPPVRRSHVLWFCSKHPLDGEHICQENDSELIKLSEKYIDRSSEGVSQKDINALISSYPDQPFYSSRMESYLNPSKKNTERTYCCYAGMIAERKATGFNIFQDLLNTRANHYKTQYILLFDAKNYKGKHVKHSFKCVAHNVTLSYSMQDLNYITSCPCPECRKDPKHQNVCVDIVKKHNSGRPGQVIRHATKVKEKYNYTCALSNSTFQLHHHHVDGQDFYQETALNWDVNGICLCGPIHRDYHNNFLKKHSLITKEYLNYSFNIDNDEWVEISSPSSSLHAGQKPEMLDFESNPDYLPNGAEVSRYTFLEYLKFLIFDIKYKNSFYVNNLNKKIKSVHSSLKPSDPSFGNLGQITLNQLEKAIDKYCREYKGENWALSNRTDILFANDPQLWAKVDNSWQ
jgi:hypothetical protein